ncbi:MAG: T9SS type A sorting domain-containing protein [Bacteroidota bacterium]|nr:T9SS type A sorting domain-containing protein [Bacteroidota bacterium]
MKTKLLLFVLSFYGLNASAQWDTVAKPAEYYPAHYITSNNNILYAGVNNGIYSSNDNGYSWGKLGSFTPGEIIFAGGNTIYGKASNTIYKSSDSGLSWELDSMGLPTMGTGETLSLYYDGTSVFVSFWYSSYAFYYKTAGTSESWTKITEIGSNGAIVYSVIKKGNSLFAAVSNGCWESTDGGLSWIKKAGVNFPLETSSWLQAATGKSFIVHNNSLYFGATNGIYKSDDNGDNWTRIDVGFVETFGTATISALYTDGTNIYAGTRNSNNAYMSSDNGSTWTDISQGLTGNPMSFTSHNSSIYATLFSQKNVFKYGSGGSTGVHTSSNNTMGVTIWPNPSNGKLNISYKNQTETLDFKMYDLSGRVILTQQLPSDLVNSSIDVSNINPGCYIVKINSASASSSSRIIIQ